MRDRRPPMRRCRRRQPPAAASDGFLGPTLTRGDRPPLPQASLKKKEAELELVAPYSRSYGRTTVKNVLENESEGLSLVGAAGCWVLAVSAGCWQ